MNLLFPTKNIELELGETITFNQVTGKLDASRIEGDLPAEQSSYDNTESGLEATNVQDAIDEVNTKIENIPSVDAYTKQESDQKYATKTALQTVANAVEGKANIEDVEQLNMPINLYNGTVWNINGYLNERGVLTENASYRTTGAVYLQSGNYLFLGLGESYKLYGYKCNEAGVISSVIQGVDTGETYKNASIIKITLQENGYYRFNLGIANGYIRTSFFMIVLGDNATDFPEQDEYYFEPFYSIKESLVNSTKLVKSVVDESENIFDGIFSPIEGYFNGNRIVEAAGYKTTKPIYLKQGEYRYTIYYQTYGTASIYYAKCDESGAILGYEVASRNGATITMGGNAYDVFDFAILNEGYYFFNAGAGVKANYFMLLKHEEDLPSGYVPYHKFNRIERDVRLSESMAEEVMIIAQTNPLANKSISADGDSICYGASYRGGYTKIISERNNMSYENLSISGGTITAETYSAGGSARHWICRTMQNISSGADYILIEGGVNDSSLGVTLGTLSSDYNAELDDTTFYGAIETIFKTLTTKYVGKKYGFIIPHRMSNGMNPNGNYYNAIVESAEKWGVKVLDLTKSVPPFNGFRNDTTLDAIRQAYTNDGDGWHPTEICYRQYYVPQIEAWLKTL